MMIKRSRRRRGGWFSSLSRFRKSNIYDTDFLPEAVFAMAVEKERSRSERRELSFCVALFDFEELTDDEALERHHELAKCFRERLRITDEVGMFRKSFAVLFPETIPLQAAHVINDLTSIAASEGIKVTSEIFAYPEVNMDSRPPNTGNDGVFEIEVRESQDFNDNEPHDESTEQEQSGGSVATVAKAQWTSPSRPQKMPTVSKLNVRRLDTQNRTPRLKRALDIFGASVGLVMLSPVLLAAAAMIRLNSKGPALFLQWREGKDGQLFRIYKFRTMRVGADEEKSAFRKMSEQDGPAFKLKNDPRITSVGRYLRKSCVDELPQLINVLKGEMSLVGPRPLPVDETLNCSTWHRRRLDVQPGMTCIWQVDGGRDIPFDDWMRMDLDYIRQRSMFTDLKLIAKTAIVTLLHRGSV